MDPMSAAERAQPSRPDPGDPDAIDFVRFCYRRRRVGWPELYDEMCAVAGRGLYRGYNSDDLNGIGIGFALYELPALATIVQRVVAEDQERRRASVRVIRASYVGTTEPEPTIDPAPATIAPQGEDAVRPIETTDSKRTETPLRLAAATAGA